MRYIIPLAKAAAAGTRAVGGKACALSRIMNAGIAVADGICVTTDAYRYYMENTGLGNSISTHLMRKQFEDMRWEEIWDVALRIRNQFILTPFPEPLRVALLPDIERIFGENYVAVRSSAPDEDAGDTSFAGLHDSFVNVSGIASIMENIRLVWASLWSDRALLYRQEIGLQVEQSTMGVVIQKMITGERSGIAFTQNPVDASQGIIEAVYGLNQGLVDGTVEPDQWIINKSPLHILQHREAARRHALRPAVSGTQLTPLDAGEQSRPPLDDTEVLRIFQSILQMEALFGGPQDTEWTLRDNEFYLLQARPITRLHSESDGDLRGWYISLSRSHENLKMLQERIEKDIIPAMEKEADDWAAMDLTALSDEAIAVEIRRRHNRFAYWEDVYKDDFIPFAHGMRLFGQFYNDTAKPEDPYEFMELLAGADLISKKRNRHMEELAEMLRGDQRLAAALREKGGETTHGPFAEKLERLLVDFGDTTWGTVRLAEERAAMIQLLLAMAERPLQKRDAPDGSVADKTKIFLDRFDEQTISLAISLLEIGRASYRLRDNDNIYLGRLQGQMLASVAAGCSRLEERGAASHSDYPPEEVARALISPGYMPKPRLKEKTGENNGENAGNRLKARQIVGQPASRGIGVGVARVVTTPEALFEFRVGEVLVCDAIDPNMTFIVPLAAGIVERRGGMLIHGAIIAREYGIPCVTGVPDATTAIRTGEKVAVDGHLGIVVIG